MVRDQVVGVLDCQSEKPDYFDSDTIDLLTLFSTQASMALQNSHLYSLERRRASQLQAINAIAQQMTAVLDLKELLYKVCLLVQEAFQAAHVSVLLKEEDELVLRAITAISRRVFPKVDEFRLDTDYGGGRCARQRP